MAAYLNAVLVRPACVIVLHLRVMASVSVNRLCHFVQLQGQWGSWYLPSFRSIGVIVCLPNPNMVTDSRQRNSSIVLMTLTRILTLTCHVPRKYLQLKIYLD